MEIPAVNLKAIVFVHWLLTIWGCMASWLPSSYAWGNFTVLALAVWAIVQRDSVDAVLMFLVGMVMTMLTDIIHFGIFYPLADNLTDRTRDTFRFSVGMAILSLLLKPVSCFFVYQMYRERGGDYNVNFASSDLETSVDSRCTTDSADSAPFSWRY
ncbi:type-1 angiotensin II receptor-associated protein isoform X2 [Brienomyrus brachyistius]|uniref:type-1 angiotensin II receptor-associated protein isoform X2 n=1 Tax=Brienomyrus brachyistius TaxID=42636 RepID=UPI0020B3884E|nr:type-1 angiotensin II receptor-associated protein isoform X2 [Brienomyrus brachyistius]